MYIPNPIYLEKSYFTYHLEPDYALKFDIEDLFYYSSHKIMKRGSHLFVADYGSQLSVLQRYGIQSYAVEGRDYQFVNDDPTDFRYENIIIINLVLIIVVLGGYLFYLVKKFGNGNSLDLC